MVIGLRMRPVVIDRSAALSFSVAGGRLSTNGTAGTLARVFAFGLSFAWEIRPKRRWTTQYRYSTLYGRFPQCRTVCCHYFHRFQTRVKCHGILATLLSLETRSLQAPCLKTGSRPRSLHQLHGVGSLVQKNRVWPSPARLDLHAKTLHSSVIKTTIADTLNWPGLKWAFLTLIW